MKKKHFVSRSLQSGLTLIELLVVMGIISILASVTIVAVNPAHQFALARDSQRTANVAAILDAIDQNMTEHGGAMICNDGSSFDFSKITGNAQKIQSDSASGDIAKCLVPTYLPVLPFDPSPDPSNNYHYTSYTDYKTGYQVFKNESNRIMVSAVSEISPGGNGIVAVR
ncbi:MAG: type II secretion system protein [Patescibacteria group bacterium]|nr:type II secretion system protein [Patescibacteria group bacterium]